MSPRLLLPLALVVLAAVAAWLWLRREDAREPRPVANVASGSATAGESVSNRPAETPRAEPIRGVRRLGVDERRQLAAQIEAARTRARSRVTKGSDAPALPPDDLKAEQVVGALRPALKEAIPILADCYETVPGAKSSTTKAAAVQMTMYSDPDIGTVIDTAAMTDPDGKPLEPALDDCLRTTIESLGMPPLPAGGRLKLQYSFRFED